MANLTTPAVLLGRKHVEKYLLPLTCQLIPKQAQSGISATGLPTFGSATPRTWRGVPDIPCRRDESRSFIPDRLKSQTTDVNGFTVELPYDAPVENSDTILIAGISYEIRKLAKATEADVSTVALVMELTADVDVTA
jgi:hypothetical protein